MIDFKQIGKNPIAAAVVNVATVTKDELDKAIAADTIKAKKAAVASLDYLDKQVDQAKNEVEKI